MRRLTRCSSAWIVALVLWAFALPAAADRPVGGCLPAGAGQSTCSDAFLDGWDRATTDALAAGAVCAVRLEEARGNVGRAADWERERCARRLAATTPNMATTDPRLLLSLGGAGGAALAAGVAVLATGGDRATGLGLGVAGLLAGGLGVVLAW